MGLIGEVQAVERSDGKLDITADPGGGANVSAEHFAPSGDDSPPLAGDSVALEDSAGSGLKQATGYYDPNNESKAADGEKRIYARDATGAATAEIWLKGDGSIEITAIKAGAKVTIHGVEIDQSGNLSAPGLVTGGAAVPAAQVGLTTHTHPVTAAPGTTGPPIPGT